MKIQRENEQHRKSGSLQRRGQNSCRGGAHRVARESEQPMTVFGFHLFPRAFLLDFSPPNPRTNQKNGPVFGFQLNLMCFLRSYSTQHRSKRADSALCYQKCMFGGGRTLVLERPRWNHASSPTKQGWGCWLWWFLATSGHFCECRLSTGRPSQPHFSMGSTF